MRNTIYFFNKDMSKLHGKLTHKHILFLSFLLVSGNSIGGDSKLPWKLISEISINSNDTNYIRLTENNVDIDVLVKRDGKELSVQNGPCKRGCDEFVVLKPNNGNEVFQIFIRPTTLVDFEPSVKVVNQTLSSKTDKELYLLLYEFSQLLYSQPTSNTFEIIKFRLLNEASENFDVVSFLGWLCIESQDYICSLNHGKKLMGLTDEKYSIIGHRILANSYLHTNNFVSARKHYKTLIKRTESYDTIRWRLNRADFMASLGMSIAFINREDGIDEINGLNEIQFGLNEAIELGDVTLISEVLNTLSSYHAVRNEYTQSEAALEIAANLLRDTSHKEGLYAILNNLAMIFEMTGRLNKSLSTYREASLLLLEDEIKNKSLADVYNNIAGVYLQLGNYVAAIEFYKNSYVTYENVGHNQGKAVVLRGLGKSERKLGNYNKALEYHFQSRELFKRIYETEQKAITDIEISKDYYSLNQLNLAKKWALLAQQNLGPNVSIEHKVDILILLGKFAVIQQEYEDLGDIIKLLDDKFNEKKITAEQLLKKYALKLKYYSDKGDFIKLEKLSIEIIEYISKVRGELINDESLLMWSDTTNFIVDLYISEIIKGPYKNEELIAMIHNVLELTESIGIRERRARIYYDQRETNKKSQVLLKDKLYNYLQAEHQYINKKDTSDYDRAFIEMEEARINYLNHVNLHFQEPIVTKPDILELSEVQKLMQPNELVVRYHVQKDYILTIVVYKEGLDMYKVDRDINLDKAVNEVVASLMVPGPIDTNGSIKNLQNLIPLSLIEEKEIEKLVIIPDGFLYKLPFAALNISDDFLYRPLILNVEIIRTYSLSDYYQKNIKPNDLITKDISIFANPDFTKADRKEGKVDVNSSSFLSSFEPLPFTQKEAEYIEDIFGSNNVEIYDGKEATNSTLLSKKFRNSNMVHIATHGVLVNDKLSKVGLATSVGKESKNLSGFLTLNELISLPFNSSLVVVSGCETTVGKYVNGEGLNGLSRGLISQGVGAVIATIWSISDRSTPIFMKTFYDALKGNNGDVSKALSLTKRKFAKSEELRRYSHPYYWAGFVFTSSNSEFSERVLH